MNVMRYLAAALFSVTLINISYADPVEHFQGKSADTLAVAISNFNKGNQRLKKMLSQDSLSGTDIAAIHELTYTLENALAKINDDLKQLTVTLEELHLASEDKDAVKVKTQGDKYLSVANDLSSFQ